MSVYLELARALRLDRPLCCTDTESTGANPAQDRVVEIAVRKVMPDGQVMTWRSYINPGRPIPPSATAVHHITDAMVADAPRFETIALFLAGLFIDADVMGYNAGRFDVRILDTEFKFAGVPSPFKRSRVIDPCRIFMKKQPRDLTAALEFFCRKQHEGAHGALADVDAAIQVLLGQISFYGDLPESIDALSAFCSWKDPSWIDADGKLIWRDGDACIGFGKNSGIPLKQLARVDRSYLEWVLKSEFSDEVKSIVRDALRGKFPTAPAIAVEA